MVVQVVTLIFGLKGTVGKSSDGFSIIINQAFLKIHLPDVLEQLLTDIEKNKSNQVGIAINIDREKKVLHFAFSPHKDIPQYYGKMYDKKNGTVNITNRMLGNDVWTLFDMSEKVTKQFFDAELVKEIEGVKIFRITYDPKSDKNTLALIQNQVKPKK